MLSTVRSLAFRSKCLSLAKTCSIGFRSGELRRQEEQPRACSSYRASYGMRFVAAEIIEHDDVSGVQRRDEDLPDIELEQFAVDRAVDDPRRVDAVMAQGGEEGHGLPMAIGDHRSQSLAARAPAAQRRHVGLHPGLVDEDEAPAIDAVLIGLPAGAFAEDVRPDLLRRHDGFWKLSPSR